MILEAFYLFIPAFLANMAPVLVRGRIRMLDIPLDFGKNFLGKPILGNNKTFRGLAIGISAAMGATYLQYLMMPYIDGLVDYSSWGVIGFLLGLGAIVGDALESFFKRRVGIKPGRPWVPFDQIDFIIGALIFVSLYSFPGWDIAITVILLSFFLHILVNHLAYYMGIRKERW